MDSSTYYAKTGDDVKSGGEVDVTLKGVYYALNADKPIASSHKSSTGYTVATSDATIISGFYLVNANALANAASGTHSEYDNIDAVAMSGAVYVQAGDTITVTIKATTATTSSAKITFSGNGIVTKTITVDKLAKDAEVPVTLVIDSAIAGNIGVGGISVKVDTVTP